MPARTIRLGNGRSCPNGSKSSLLDAWCTSRCRLAFGAIADQINDALARLALGHANVHILDWGYLEYGNPAWLEPDLIHPTPSGQAELATLETQEIRRYC